MADIMTPALGESVAEATVARWTKKVGDAVKRDEMLIELETDKVSLEVVSPADGVLTEIVAAEAAGTPLPDDAMLATRFTLDGVEGSDDWWDFQTDGYGTWVWAAVAHARRHRLGLERWSQGINAGFVNYQASAMHSSQKGGPTRSQQDLYLNSGLNIGGWRLRSNQSLREDEHGQRRWTRSNTYAQTDLPGTWGTLAAWPLARRAWPCD